MRYKKTLNIIHGLGLDVEVKVEPSVYCKNDLIYIVPNNCYLQDMVKGSDYRRLKRLMKESNNSLLNRLKFLFKGFAGVR